MDPSLRIQKVAVDSAEFAAFVDLPWRIYPGKVLWVPPLRAAIAQDLSPSSAFFTHGEAQCFLAYRGDEVVGRIVASVDHTLADPKVGHFGYFEVLDDLEAAQALLEHAEAWVKARDRSELHGPIELNVFNTYRIQTAGFERAPFHGEPRSPRYYARLLEACGFKPLHEWRSWDIPGWIFPFIRLMTAAKTRKARKILDTVRIEPFDTANFEAECRALYPLVLSTFDRNYGFTPITFEEYYARFGMGAAIISGTTSFKGVNPEGRTVGYFYTYRDPAPAFIAADGDYAKLDLAAHRSDTLVFYTIGIQREYRKLGIIEAGWPQTLDGIRQGRFKRIVGALAKEGPTVYDMFGMATRRYAVYARPCGG